MAAKVLSIATHKGGTGKTVTAMALSTALALAGKQTLLVDLDPQGHSTLGVGLELAAGDHTIRDVFTTPPLPIAKVIRSTAVAGLDILPSNIRLAYIDALYRAPKREEMLQRALKPALGQYDFVVIDCPPSLGPFTEVGLGAADQILIPCQMEARAADGLVDLLEIIHLIKGEGYDNWRILLTKLDGRKKLTNEAVMTALAPWRRKILKTTIPQSEPLNQAQMVRKDIFTFDHRSAGAVAYQALSREILNHYGQ